MTKQQFFSIMDGIDDDLIENYLGITADESKPKKVYLSERRAPIWKYALAAAAAVCVIAAGVFAAVKLRGVQTITPNDSTFSSSGVSISESSDASDSSSAIIGESFSINQEIVSELGMTYSQLVEKYGEPLNTSDYKGYKFKDGNGLYRFLFYDNLGNIGVCDMINAIKAENLLSGVSFPIKTDEMESKYGFVCVYTDSEPTLYDCYWTCFTRPDYPNIEFVFYLNEYGFITGDTSCIIKLKGLNGSESSSEQSSLINKEIVSELGMTYSQLVEKYGEPLNTSSNNKGYKFKDGNGLYRFLFYDNLGNIGVCDMINAIKAENLLSGVTFPIKTDEMESKYGFVCVYTDSEPTLYDCYWTCFTRPDSPNIEFVFYLNEYGFITGDTGCIIQLKGLDDSESSSEKNS